MYVRACVCVTNISTRNYVRTRARTRTHTHTHTHIRILTVSCKKQICAGCDTSVVCSGCAALVCRDCSKTSGMTCSRTSDNIKLRAHLQRAQNIKLGSKWASLGMVKPELPKDAQIMNEALADALRKAQRCHEFKKSEEGIQIGQRLIWTK